MIEYLLLDSARRTIPFETIINFKFSYESLYTGELKDELADVAPYLIIGSDSYRIRNWFFSEGSGNAWGILLNSNLEFNEVRSHFRKFLLVKTEDGQELYFRFYDPRVLKIFLPTCDKQQILEFFGPVESFIVEGDTKEQAIRFWHQNGELKQEILPVEEVFGQAITNDITI